MLPQDLKKAKGHVWGVVYGFIAVLFITPCVGFAMREIPLDPQLFAAGEAPTPPADAPMAAPVSTQPALIHATVHGGIGRAPLLAHVLLQARRRKRVVGTCALACVGRGAGARPRCVVSSQETRQARLSDADHAVPRDAAHCPMVAGLMMYCLVPTTLGVGVALVRACKGNEGVALIMTVGTNMLGVVSELAVSVRQAFANPRAPPERARLAPAPRGPLLLPTALAHAATSTQRPNETKRSFAEPWQRPQAGGSSSRVCCVACLAVRVRGMPGGAGDHASYAQVHHTGLGPGGAQHHGAALARGLHALSAHTRMRHSHAPARWLPLCGAPVAPEARRAHCPAPPATGSRSRCRTPSGARLSRPPLL